MQYFLEKNLTAFWSSPGSSLFQKMMRKFRNFDDYVTTHYVIDDDVIGYPDVRTDNSGLGLHSIENRLAKYCLQ